MITAQKISVKNLFFLADDNILKYEWFDGEYKK